MNLDCHWDQGQTTEWSSKSCNCLHWEGCFKLAFHPSNTWAWIGPPKFFFRTNQCLQYDRRSPPYHHTCVVTSSLSCSQGAFPSVCHNEIWDWTVDLLSGVCHNVGTEPQLQPVTDERLTHRSASLDGAQLDVVARSFCGDDRQTHFWCQSFQPLCAKLLKLLPSHVLSQKWIREEESF